MLPGSSLVGLASVVTATGPHLHATKSFRLRFDAHRTISPLRLRFDGLVADGVLIADIVRHVLRDLIDFTQVVREECHASGAFRERTQSALVALLARFVVAKDPDGIDDRPVLVLHVWDGLFQSHAAGVD